MTGLRKAFGPDRHPAFEVLVLLAAGSLDRTRQAETGDHVASCVACGLMSDLIGPLRADEVDTYLWNAFGDSIGETADWAGPSRPTLPLVAFWTGPADLPRLPGTVVPSTVRRAVRPPAPGLRLAADDSSAVVPAVAEGTEVKAVRMTRDAEVLRAQAERELAGRGWELFLHSRDLEDTDQEPIAAGAVPKDGVIKVSALVLHDAIEHGLQLVWRFEARAREATDVRPNG